MSDQVKAEICEAFAKENSGEHTEWSDEANADVLVTYEYDEVFNYCVDVIEPEMKTDKMGTYYEFEIFICGQTYQDSVMAYIPSTKELENLGGSGGGESCPYAK